MVHAAIHSVASGHMVVKKTFRTVDLLIPISLARQSGVPTSIVPETLTAQNAFLHAGGQLLRSKSARHITLVEVTDSLVINTMHVAVVAGLFALNWR